MPFKSLRNLPQQIEFQKRFAAKESDVVFVIFPGVAEHEVDNLPGRFHGHTDRPLGYVAVCARQIAFLRDEKGKFDGGRTSSDIMKNAAGIHGTKPNGIFILLKY